MEELVGVPALDLPDVAAMFDFRLELPVEPDSVPIFAETKAPGVDLKATTDVQVLERKLFEAEKHIDLLLKDRRLLARLYVDKLDDELKGLCVKIRTVGATTAANHTKRSKAWDRAPCTAEACNYTSTSKKSRDDHENGTDSCAFNFNACRGRWPKCAHKKHKRERQIRDLQEQIDYWARFL